MLECSIFAQLTPLFIWDDFNSLLAFLIRYSRFFTHFLFQTWNQPFFKEAFVPFGGEYYLETMIQVLGMLIAIGLILTPS